MKMKFILIVVLAMIFGLGITWIDSSPNWDDSGISAMMVLLAATFLGYLTTQKPWLIAIAFGIWIPLYGIATTQNFGSLLALIPAFVGAYLGFYIRKR